MNENEEHTGRTITIRLYHTDRSGSARRPRQLVRTLYVPSDSAKPLTTKRAAQVLARSLPQFSPASRAIIIRTDEGGGPLVLCSRPQDVHFTTSGRRLSSRTTRICPSKDLELVQKR